MSGFAYSFGGSCIILFIMNLIPGLKLRASEEAEVLGMDDAEIGEFAYDYVELTRDVINGDALVAPDDDDEGMTGMDDDSLGGRRGARSRGMTEEESRGGLGSKFSSRDDDGGSATVLESVGVMSAEKGGFGSSVGEDERALRGGLGRR